MSRQDNRARCPKFAAAMDQVRAVWPEARVRFVQEGDVTLGEMPADDLVEIDASTYIHAMEQDAYLRTRKTKRGDL